MSEQTPTFKDIQEEADEVDRLAELEQHRIKEMNKILVLAKDLDAQGALFCPTAKDLESDPNPGLATGHPKVYLDVARTGEAKCPYCGNVFKLVKTIGSPTFIDFDGVAQ